MTPRIWLAVFLIACLGGASHAENKKKEEAIIVEVSPLALTVQRGEAYATYKIPKDSIICLNGLPATADDLRAGMMVTIRADSSRTLALAIRAHNPPRR